MNEKNKMITRIVLVRNLDLCNAVPITRRILAISRVGARVKIHES